MIYVSDLATFVQAALEENAAEGVTLEVDDGCVGGYGWEDVARAAGSALGRSSRLIRIPRPLLYGTGLLNEIGVAFGRPPAMLTRGKVREICHPDWTCRTDSLRPITGWRPSVPLEAGFAQTLAWYRAERWL
jgi:nucleoside-diphosphate-sugar epimerase